MILSWKNKFKKRSICSEIKHLRRQKYFENNYIKSCLKTSAVEKSMRKIRDQLTFCSIRHFTERNDPKNIGKSAIKTKLEYATNNPSGVAAALPVTFFAVSFTVAERFATVSFTTDSAILTERERDLLFEGNRPSHSSYSAWSSPVSSPMIETHVNFTAFLLPFQLR